MNGQAPPRSADGAGHAGRDVEEIAACRLDRFVCAHGTLILSPYLAGGGANCPRSRAGPTSRMADRLANSSGISSWFMREAWLVQTAKRPTADCRGERRRSPRSERLQLRIDLRVPRCRDQGWPRLMRAAISRPAAPAPRGDGVFADDVVVAAQAAEFALDEIGVARPRRPP